MNGLADHPSDVLRDRGEGESECGSSVDLREFRGMRTARNLRMGYRDADGLLSCGDLSESERIVVVRAVLNNTDRSS
jgi:hypothetical protein